MGIPQKQTMRSALRRVSSIYRGRASSSIAVHSPRDGMIIAELWNMTVSEVDTAVRGAKTCLSSAWSKPSAAEHRAAAIREISSELRHRSEELARLETLDCGKTLSESHADIAFCADVCDYYAEIAPRVLIDEPIKVPDDNFSSRNVPAPAGIAVCITPWNYPLLQAVAKVAPALAAGCPVLLKPSPLASLTCLELEKITRTVLPDGALKVITGGPPAGLTSGIQRLVSHPNVDVLSFTGSGRGGKHLLHESAEMLRRSTLELGGKGGLIVFEVSYACV